MSVRLLTDIDDTLMSTGRKVPEALRAVVGAVAPNGEPSSFQTPKQRMLWDLFVKAADSIVPVSARSPKALARMALPMKDGAIADFGATVLHVDGSVDQVWYAQMQKLAADREFGDIKFFEMLASFIEGSAPTEVKVELRAIEGMAAFVNFRGAPGSAPAVRESVEIFMAVHVPLTDYYLHVTDRDVTVLPSFVSKCRAAAYLIEQRGWQNDLLLGAGDSLSDSPFLAGLDFALLPTNSRAFKALMGVVGQQGQMPTIASPLIAVA